MIMHHFSIESKEDEIILINYQFLMKPTKATKSRTNQFMYLLGLTLLMSLLIILFFSPNGGSTDKNQIKHIIEMNA